MLRIVKGAAPPSLLACKKQSEPAPTYAGFREVQALRDSLERDQRGLCCYCMRRIRATEQHMKVEHLRSQRRHPAQQLDWNNLLGACPDVAGARLADQTCDSHKGDADIALDPLTLPPQSFSYTETGTLVARNAAHQSDVDETLNLNCVALKQARRAVLDAIRKELRAELGAGAWTRAALERKLAVLASKRPLPPLFGMIEFWLERHARRR